MDPMDLRATMDISVEFCPNELSPTEVIEEITKKVLAVKKVRGGNATLMGYRTRSATQSIASEPVRPQPMPAE